MSLTFKVTDLETSTTRKLILPRPAPSYRSLVEIIIERFNLEAATVELEYEDEDGDTIALSSDEELQGLVSAAESTGKPVRFNLRTLGTAAGAVNKESEVLKPRDLPTPTAEPVLLTRDAKASSKGEVRNTSREVEQEEETQAVDDPADPPLLDTLAPAWEQAASESSSTVSLSDVDDFPDDPLDIPLPSTSADSLPFSNLPNSLSTFLASLGSRSSTFSTNLVSALSPTSPDSPAARISSILNTASLEDLPLVASSLAQIGTEFAEVAKDVALGVRKEADEIRNEFVRLREEVERERGRFRDELRGAVNQARAEEVHSMADASANPPPRGPVESSVRTESVRSSVPATGSSSMIPDAAPGVSRETSRILHRQAKQARKDYRAAVRQAREEKKRSKATTSPTELTSDCRTLPGSMP